MEKYTSDFETVKSLNFENCITKNTKLVIVGTLTPPQGQGYFYTASRNRIYGYIDDACGTKLKELKKTLVYDRQNAVEKIKEVLKNKKIAFLDVIETATRKKYSHLDKDIKNFDLDFESFKMIANKNVTVICNSRLAERCYNEIKKKFANENKILPESIVLSQRCSKKVEWIEKIQNALR